MNSGNRNSLRIFVSSPFSLANTANFIAEMSVAFSRGDALTANLLCTSCMSLLGFDAANLPRHSATTFRTPSSSELAVPYKIVNTLLASSSVKFPTTITSRSA